MSHPEALGNAGETLSIEDLLAICVSVNAPVRNGAAIDWADRFAAPALRRLAAEVERLKQAIRSHRGQRADDRCIEDDDKLYAALGDGIPCDRRVGDKFAMARSCLRFIDRRCEGGHWPSYVELEAERDALKASLERMTAERDDWEKQVDDALGQLQEIADQARKVVPGMPGSLSPLELVQAAILRLVQAADTARIEREVAEHEARSLKAMAPEDHPVLDTIAGLFDQDASGWPCGRLRRESECCEFYDPRVEAYFELVVRRIAGPSRRGR